MNELRHIAQDLAETYFKDINNMADYNGIIFYSLRSEEGWNHVMEVNRQASNVVTYKVYRLVRETTKNV